MISEHSNTRSPSTRLPLDPRSTTNSATRSSANAPPRLKQFSPPTTPAGLCKCPAATERRKSSNCSGMRLKWVPGSYDATADALRSGSHSTQARGVSKPRRSTYEPWQLSAGRIRGTPTFKGRGRIQVMQLRCNRRTTTSEQ